MDATALLADLKSRGIALVPNGEKLTVEPASLLTDDDRAAIRQQKAELLALLSGRPTVGRVDTAPDPASEALTILKRLRCFSLPAGRLPVVLELARRLEPLKTADDATMRDALVSFEHQLIDLGGAPDPEIVEAVGLVTTAFSDAKLVEVRPKYKC